MLEHHENGERDWWTFGSPIRLNDSPSLADNTPGRLGQHTDEILTEKLKLDTSAIETLLAMGVYRAFRRPRSHGLPNGRTSLSYADTADV